VLSWPSVVQRGVSVSASDIDHSVKNTIKRSAEISELFKSARKCYQKDLVLFVAEEELGRGPDGRVAYLAGKRLGSAPLRNRSKRMLREAARLEGAPWNGQRCLLVARGGMNQVTLNDLRKQLRKARLINKPDDTKSD